MNSVERFFGKGQVAVDAVVLRFDVADHLAHEATFQHTGGDNDNLTMSTSNLKVVVQLYLLALRRRAASGELVS